MTYDQWKCTDPREYEPDPCEHEDYDIDTIEGRCECTRCGERWNASEADWQAGIDSEIFYAQYIERMESPGYRFREWCASQWRSLKRALQPRRKAAALDDDIPF